MTNIKVYKADGNGIAPDEVSFYYGKKLVHLFGDYNAVHSYLSARHPQVLFKTKVI